MKKAAAWKPLVDITAACSDEFLNALEKRERAKLVAVLRSPLYEVYQFEVDAPGWPGDSVTWLSIKRRDKASVHDWRHLQQIKNEVCGKEREAMEMFPAESRLVDTSNQYHLWVLAEGHRFPFGYDSRAVVKATQREDVYTPERARQRPFEPGLEPPDALSTEEAQQLLASMQHERRA